MPYLIKVTTKGGEGSKIPKILTTWFMDDPLPNPVLSVTLCAPHHEQISSVIQHVGCNLCDLCISISLVHEWIWTIRTHLLFRSRKLKWKQDFRYKMTVETFSMVVELFFPHHNKNVRSDYSVFEKNWSWKTKEILKISCFC